MIRLATMEDVPQVVELGKQSLIDGPYSGLVKFSHEHVTRFATLVIQALGKVLLWEEDGQVVGLLGFLFFPHFFSGEPTAQEIMYYILPKNRPGGSGLKLMWAAEDLAKQMGAKKMQFSAPSPAIGALYERMGYKQIEVGYQKAL